MNLLLRQVRIIDSTSPFHQQTADIFIKDGLINSIGTDLSVNAAKTVDVAGLSVSPGWLDVFASIPDPGLEYKETLQSGAAAAASGGFTDVMMAPNTAPVVHSKSGVEYIVQKTKSLPVSFHPIATVSKNAEGKELAEMYDMHQSGAVAFGDGTASILS